MLFWPVATHRMNVRLGDNFMFHEVSGWILQDCISYAVITNSSILICFVTFYVQFHESIIVISTFYSIGALGFLITALLAGPLSDKTVSHPTHHHHQFESNLTGLQQILLCVWTLHSKHGIFLLWNSIFHGIHVSSIILTEL